MQIKVQIKSVYGRDTVYPACPDAGRFCLLANTKTLTDAMLRLIEGLGYEITVVHPTVTINR